MSDYPYPAPISAHAASGSAFIAANLKTFGLLGDNNRLPLDPRGNASKVDVPYIDQHFTLGNHFKFGFDGIPFNERRMIASRYWVEYGAPNRAHEGFQNELGRAIAQIHADFGTFSVTATRSYIALSVVQEASNMGLGDSISSTPVFSRSADALFVKFGQDVFGSKGGVAAVDRASFEVSWRHHFERELAGKIVHDDARRLIIAASHSVFQAFDFSGQVRWRTRLQVQGAWSILAISPATGVVVTTNGTELVALDSSNGEKLWAVPTTDVLAPNIAWNSELFFAAECGGRLIEVSAENGEQRRSLYLAEKIYSGPVAHGSHLYVGTSGGHVFQIDLRTFKIVGRFDCLERILNPVLSDNAGTYYVRTQENGLVRVDNVTA